MTAPVEEVTRQETHGDDIVHIVCNRLLNSGDPDIAYCGKDCTGEEELPHSDYGPRECAMCLEVEAQHAPYCPTCGRL